MTGDIVWAPFPFTNLTAAKTRPALVVADVRDGSEHDWLLCEITTGRVHHAREITIARNDMLAGRLRANSRVRPDRMATLNESVFGNYIGRLTDAKLAEILAAVRALF